ncbi:MAG: dihydrolipoyl dehydrogenase [bacterium]|nr:dihydrolipoyl dehydrogenase [bacterium]
MKRHTTDIVVVGSGPGGYAAAFYAADMGKSVVLVEKAELGGVCLNRGCIPSKALLNVAHTIEDAQASENRGLTFSKPKIDLKKMRSWKNGIVEKLQGGVEQLAKMRKVTIIQGRGYFESSTELRVETQKGNEMVEFGKAIIATGSRPAMPAAFDLGNPRIMTSTEALEIEEIPENLLVVGAGYIGMELGTVYAALGSKVTMVEAMDTILLGADRDLVRPILKYAEAHFETLKVSHKVTKMETKGKKIKVGIQGPNDKKAKSYEFDRVLVSVGRTANSNDLGLENTGVKTDDRGFVKIDNTQKTDDANIYAIGDIAGGLLLAHKASKEARVAVENIMGQPSTFDNITIPAVCFTHPEIAWAGLTESEAKEKGIKVKVSKYPWTANGRALSFDATNGYTKLILHPETHRVLGGGIVGQGAGELIGEITFAIEMGANAEDLALTVHPHPTLSETVMEVAEAFYGHATHIVSKNQS